jgi:ribosomal protein L7Ae-like RNA K-turn-binding protein
MESPSLITAVKKLASLGELAGLPTDQMVQILEAGFTVEDLVRLIDSRLLAP